MFFFFFFLYFRNRKQQRKSFHFNIIFLSAINNLLFSITSLVNDDDLGKKLSLLKTALRCDVLECGWRKSRNWKEKKNSFASWSLVNSCNLIFDFVRFIDILRLFHDQIISYLTSYVCLFAFRANIFFFGRVTQLYVSCTV